MPPDPKEATKDDAFFSVCKPLSTFIMATFVYTDVFVDLVHLSCGGHKLIICTRSLMNTVFEKACRSVIPLSLCIFLLRFGGFLGFRQFGGSQVKNNKSTAFLQHTVFIY